MSACSIRLWYLRETPDARRYCKLPESRSPGPDVHENPNYVWVPKSIIEHTTKYPARDNEGALHVVTLPDWFVRKEGL